MKPERPYSFGNPAAMGAAALTGNDILTITDNGSALARVTTVAAHGLTTGNSVTVSGTAEYNLLFESITVVSAIVFDCNDVTYTGDNTGGRWDLA